MFETSGEKAMSRPLSLILVLPSALALEACCHCPPPTVTCVAPPSAAPGAAPASAATRALRLPGRLPFPQRSPPASLEALLKDLKRSPRSFAAFRFALSPYIGGRVRWRLRSWGGEHSSVGYETPSGTQPVKLGEADVGRIRFISESLGESANLVSTWEAELPVVTCLATFSRHDDALFVRGDGKRAKTPDRGLFTIEATIWGATREGSANLWLHDCAVVEGGSRP